MQIQGLTIHNIGMIEHEEIVFDHALLLFYGEVQQGKSTILNAVRWTFGGSFPSDIIRRGEKEAFTELKLDDGIIRREFYVSEKDGETKARDIMFMRDGRPVSSPVNEIKRLLNPFLQDQNHLIKMGETERKQYFAEMFSVDTKQLDNEYFEKDREASALRRKIKDYGFIDTNPVPETNAQAIRDQIADVRGRREKQNQAWREEIKEIRRKHSAEVQQIGQKNTDATGINGKRQSAQDRIVDLDIELDELRAKVVRAQKERDEKSEFLKNNPAAEILPAPPEPEQIAQLEAKILMPDFEATELSGKLEQAARDEERRTRYLENVERAKQRDADQEELKKHEARLAEIRKLKIAKLADVSAKSGIPGLKFNESGVFVYDGTQAGMLSTSQLMKLSSQLSALYPKGLGIELIDRAESLGKSVFGFIEKAKAENKTILATIVGEAPAKVPEEIGVFVVAAGKVTARAKKAAVKPAAAKELL